MNRAENCRARQLAPQLSVSLSSLEFLVTQQQMGNALLMTGLTETLERLPAVVAHGAGVVLAQQVASG